MEAGVEQLCLSSFTKWDMHNNRPVDSSHIQPDGGGRKCELRTLQLCSFPCPATRLHICAANIQRYIQGPVSQSASIQPMDLYWPGHGVDGGNAVADLLDGLWKREASPALRQRAQRPQWRGQGCSASA